MFVRVQGVQAVSPALQAVCIAAQAWLEAPVLKAIPAAGAADSRGEVAGMPQLLWAAAAQDARQLQIWAAAAPAVQAGTASIAQQSCWRSSNPQVRACTQLGEFALRRCSCFSACNSTLCLMCPAHSWQSWPGLLRPAHSWRSQLGLDVKSEPCLFGCLQVRARHGASHPTIDWLHPVMAALQTWLTPLLERHMQLLSKQALQQVNTCFVTLSVLLLTAEKQHAGPSQ